MPAVGYAVRGGSLEAAGLVLLHCAVRAAANANATLRASAVLASTPRHGRVTAALGCLCSPDQAPQLHMMLRWAKSPPLWGKGPSMGTGTAESFTKQLEQARLNYGLALPFAAAPDTEHQVAYAQGVHAGLRWLSQSQADERGPGNPANAKHEAASAAFASLFSQFCGSLDNEKEGWRRLVEWHDAVRSAHRQEGYVTWDANLEAHHLPTVKRLVAERLLDN